MTKMRIVGNNRGSVAFVQKYDNANREWTQERMNANEFEQMMRNEYPLFWSIYVNSDCDRTPIDFFYDYGQTGAYNEDTFVFC